MKIAFAPQLISPKTVEGLLNTILGNLPRNPGLPRLYSSGIRYRRDPGEVWQDPEMTARLGYGDCEDLCLYRAHELRMAGHKARCKVYRAGPGLMHVIVDRCDGRFEDPSRALGMGAVRAGEDPAPTVEVMPPGFNVSSMASAVTDPKKAIEMAAMQAAASMVPGGGVAVQLLTTPEGRQLLDALRKAKIAKRLKFW